jgi:hypothetical protein
MATTPVPIEPVVKTVTGPYCPERFEPHLVFPTRHVRTRDGVLAQHSGH